MINEMERTYIMIALETQMKTFERAINNKKAADNIRAAYQEEYAKYQNIYIKLSQAELPLSKK